MKSSMEDFAIDVLFTRCDRDDVKMCTATTTRLRAVVQICQRVSLQNTNLYT